MEIGMTILFIVGWIISLGSIRIQRFIMALIGFFNGLVIGGIVFCFFQISQMATYGALYSYRRNNDNEGTIIACILIALVVGLILAYLSFKYYKLMMVLNTILLSIEIFLIFFLLSGIVELPKSLIGILLFVGIMWSYCTYLWTDLFFILYTSLLGGCISTIPVGYGFEESINMEILVLYLLFQTIIGSIAQYSFLKKIKGTHKEKVLAGFEINSPNFKGVNKVGQKITSIFSLTLKDLIQGGKELFYNFKTILIEDQWYLTIPLLVHVVDPLILLGFYFTGVYPYIYSTYPQFFHLRVLIREALIAFSIGQYIYLIFQKKWAPCFFIVLLQILGIILIRPIFYHRVFSEILVTLLGFVFLVLIRNFLSLSPPSFLQLMILSGLAGFLNSMLPMYNLVYFNFTFYYFDILDHIGEFKTWLYLILTLLGTLISMYCDPQSSIKERR